MNLNYEELGLKVGLEIHQQLKTERKLFCHCKPELAEEEEDFDVIERRLRPVRSELGEVDVAALFEWKKGRTYVYRAPVGHSCLVEADEEPPHEADRDSIIIALAIAKAFNSKIIDEIHVMRKMVIDGSNTSGFQRTMLVALGGELNLGDKKIGIETICVEEDAARKVEEKEKVTVFNLDRLGIPLIEIATEPTITSPQEAKRVALRIGQMLRLTGRVKRGLGTIRQDLNVSIKGGTKTEIKGVQKLQIIDKVVEYEVIRQLRLLEIRDELKRRGVKEEEILSQPIKDVTEIFKDTESKLIKRSLSKGSRVYAIKLPKFKGLLGKEVQPNRRFGTELADYARFWAGVGGIIHSDELPGYGISEDEVEDLKEALGCGEEDAFVMVIAPPPDAKKALEAVKERAAYALKGVPEETRAANPDGTTRFLRPRPGSARMYPETDVPPIVVTEDMLTKAEKLKPKNPIELIQELITDYKLSKDMAEKVISSERFDLAYRLIKKYKNKLSANLVARTVVDTLRELEREGLETDKISDEAIEKVLDEVAEGKVAKEAIPEVLRKVAGGASVEEALKEFVTASQINVEEVVKKVIQQNIEEIKKRGVERSFGLVMGKAMAELRGKVDGKVVAETVKRLLKELGEEGG
ncbi:Glu-tRNA(Gln) amidotransferase subunit GatE [Ignicoccus hospitalis]|uniref:Glutamyl-tRNA(Gln) amidotransferase subunit E n=1 Tax=Ignicoccus hospitalis (strain KIN4/I / DSM 18386 / JCM 14125) TaxID=453591 RepID=A8A8K9_IGNH4|nr:Glu-tRNA(Gln) amidotransferase subunit GatE [Ignicoccus hospitalis]ABU81261.1 glutamyl-tRNA(Gln) amidotransferase subunit E [Ignicoccus hospitalis KIN4/I]HIH90943.1 Glu-tRNA(Gln) amidotransferase subunit GatE [Desulfurococcaceae archaeon]